MTSAAGHVSAEYLFPQPGRWLDLQNGLRAFPGPGYILAVAARSWATVNSGIFGGGIGQKRFFLNRQVEKGYASDCPADEMASYLTSQIASYEPAAKSEWAALMTAARVADACWLKVTHRDCQVNLIITAGVNNACSAGVTPYCASAPKIIEPGTINIMAFLSRSLTPGALVNAVQTVAEAKAQTLRELNITCPVTGAFASGTNTDATLIAAADSIPCEYAGPGTLIGYMLALGVRGALTQAVKSYLALEEQDLSGDN